VYGVRPGPFCYDGVIQTHLLNEDWENVLQTYSSMKEGGIIPLPVTYQSLISATEILGGSEKVLYLVQDVLDSDASMSVDAYLQAIQILLLARESLSSSAKDKLTFEDMRLCLRRVVDDKERGLPLPFKQDVMDLLRLLRKAEVEESRQVSKHITARQIQHRRKIAWKDLLRKLIDCADALPSRTTRL